MWQRAMTTTVLKTGDKVIVTWSDGYSIECFYIDHRSGFYVFKDSSGEKVACRPQNVKIRKIN